MKANLHFIKDTLNLFNPFSDHRKRSIWLTESYHFNFRNQFNRSLRYLKNYPFINALKIGGLSMAFCAFFFIMDYVQFHKNFDGFHENKDRIYRVVTTVTSPDLQDVTAWSHAYIKDMYDEFPSVQQVVRLLKSEEAVIVDTGVKQFEESEVFFTDEEFAQVFTFDWLEGNPETALEDPNSVVLTKRMARKYFDRGEEVLGLTLSINQESYLVTGLVDDIPSNSDLKFDLLIPLHYDNLEEWSFVYLLLQPNTSIAGLERTFPEIIDYYNDDYTDEGVTLKYDFENIQDVHFSEARLYDTPKMDKDRIFLFQLIGWIILVTALVNYVNLYTTQLLRRIRNINVQLVVGASKKQLFLEFFMEAVIYFGIALLIAIALTYFSSELLGQYVDFRFFETLSIFQSSIWLALSFLCATVLSALYALVLTAKKSNLLFIETKQIKAPVRKALIGVQFALSFAMILATLVIYRQTVHLQDQSLGFNADDVITFQFPNHASQSTIEAFKTEIRQLSSVEVVSQLEAYSVPGMDPWVEDYTIDHSYNTKLIEELGVDQYYLEALQIDLISGEFFDSRKHRSQRTFVVNKAFVDHFGWQADEAIGKELNVYGFGGRIVGVTDNFFFNSPHQLIQPMVLRYYPTATNALVRLDANADYIQSVNRMETIWAMHISNSPFNFSFLASDYALQYQHENASLNVLTTISGLVIILSLLGMYAILLMLAKSREKELGIRKVNGASLINLFDLFARDLAKILVAGIVLACPLLWLGLDQWLADYPIRISLNPISFIAVAMGVMVLAAAVIYLQASKSYASNTVESLKYE
ncbi:MAG: ABC transporter permease [Bacteroidota bacterium]